MTGFLVYILLFAPLIFTAWNKHHDIFHPWMYLIPQCIFLNAALPMAVLASDPERFHVYVGGSFLMSYQLLTVGLTASLLIGAAKGGGGRSGQWLALRVPNPRGLWWIALIIGAAGFAAWLYTVTRAGGVTVAYGTAYGGGSSDSGYIREARFIGLLGALMTYLLRAPRRLRPSDWALIALCVFPTLFHGLVGARRGPTFLALVVLGGGSLYFSRRRIGLSMAIPAMILAGVLLLFLVANRNTIYLGSGFEGLRSPLEYLERWSSNEYLYGSSVVRYANETGYFYGARELVHLVGRVLPPSVWPSIYYDLPRMLGMSFQLQINDGISQSGLLLLNGWLPSQGAAPGIVGDIWLEFGYVSFFALFLIGYFYGAMWRMASVSVNARMMYLICVALSVYLIMQGLDPWLFRLLLFGLPTLLLLKIVSRRGRRYAKTGMTRDQMAAPVPQTPRSAARTGYRPGARPAAAGAWQVHRHSHPDVGDARSSGPAVRPGRE